jgi:bifunctional non-homologous end joining protein LigD
VLYPADGITKQELALYYEAVADWILPHVEDRPLTVVRCPEGHEKGCFYQKHASAGQPGAIRLVPIQEDGASKAEDYLMVDSLQGLVSLVQMGVLEMHTWGSRTRRLEFPDQAVFDLDPDPAVPWERVVEAARLLRERLEGLGLESFLKTTGGKGLHVVVPLAARQGWEEVKEFTRLVALRLSAEFPDRYVATMSKARRRGKIFIDYLRNGRGATAVAAYSSRARRGAPVSTPVRWEELDHRLRPDAYTVRNLPQRLQRLRRDPWEGFGRRRQSITKTAWRDLGKR